MFSQTYNSAYKKKKKGFVMVEKQKLLLSLSLTERKTQDSVMKLFVRFFLTPPPLYSEGQYYTFFNLV